MFTIMIRTDETWFTVKWLRLTAKWCCCVLTRGISRAPSTASVWHNPPLPSPLYICQYHYSISNTCLGLLFHQRSGNILPSQTIHTQQIDMEQYKLFVHIYASYHSVRWLKRTFKLSNTVLIWGPFAIISCYDFLIYFHVSIKLPYNIITPKYISVQYCSIQFSNE